ncbi:RHS repeat-associated core domain-containing protein [Actinomadura litoris]|uniref:RHS repeat-associated core domain-containing protein n=1 Tax=Actinomadura litoris TaxID=2678616 RepID=UPI001FA75760|nr:RHS repeat-associated core domain-containing protein [Actinomadura litoris]
MDSFFTQAGNFTSAVSGGVDPRTGLFTVRIRLGVVTGNRGLGPSLPLTLLYSPLVTADVGLGRGVSLGLSTYDTREGLLALSTGEQYKALDIGTKVVLQQSKLDAVHVSRDEAGEWYRIVHKSGDVEILSGPKNAYRLKVPTVLLTPAGHRLTLEWGHEGEQARLQTIKDDCGTPLLKAAYTGKSRVTLHVLPDQAEGYEVELRLTDGLLTRVHHSGPGPQASPLEWSFASSPIGEDGTWGTWITGVTMPGGMTEKVTYSTGTEGHRFPDGSGLPVLPYVKRFVKAPGGEQPQITASYTYSGTNFLGYESGMSWDADQDHLYGVLGNYAYHSVEARECAGKTTRITRAFDRYHLQTEETTREGDCSRSVRTEYYAVRGKTFAEQPPQFQLPARQSVTWDGPGGSREEVTKTTFDEWGNPTARTGPDGTVTTWAYYPAAGEEGACPPEPNGYCRLPKSVTRTAPGTSFGDEPVYKTSYRYADYDTPDPRVPRAVLKTAELRCADGELLSGQELTHSTRTGTTEEKLEFGRVTGLTETEYGPDGKPYTAAHAFTVSTDEGDGLVQVHTLKSHDGRTVTRTQVRSRFTGRLQRTEDPQGNVETMTYDRLGRPTGRVANPGTAYQAVHAVDYVISDGPGPFTATSTDPLGNQVRETLDGAARPIRRERKDRDGDGAWHDVQTLAYDAQGRVSRTRTLDYERREGQDPRQIELIRDFVYDGWGQVETTTCGDGSARLTRTDPVARTATTQLYGGGDAVTGKEVTHYNARREPVRVTRYDLEGKAASERTLDRDGWGRIRRQTDEAGNITYYDYDPRGRPARITLSDGTEINRAYEPSSPGTLITELRVGEVRYGTQEFDGLGRLTSSRSGGRTWSYGYASDSDPYPASVTAPDGQVRDYQRVRQLAGALSQVTAGPLTKDFTRHPVSGSLKAASEKQDGETRVTTDRGYHPSGLLHTDTTTPTGRPGHTTSATYTVGGLDQSFTGADGAAQQITRDIHGRISQITDPAMRATLTYDPAGRVSGWTATDRSTGYALTTTLGLDQHGRETQRTIKDNQGTAWTLAQTWQPDGRLESRVLKRGTTQLRHETFTYTKRGQLARYTCGGTQPPQDEHGNTITTQAFTHDDHGNITECKTEFATTENDTARYLFTNGADPCQLTAITHTHHTYPARTTLSYDAAGRLTTIACDDKNGNALTAAGRTLDYDTLGRLQTASSPGITSQYGFDPLDRLLIQQSGDQTSVLCYQGRALASVTESAASVRGTAPETHNTRLLRNGPARLAQHRDNGPASTLLPGSDAKNSVLIAAADRQYEEYGYTPYGYRPRGSADSILGYDGQRPDPVFGWLHLGNGYRAYSPSLMRFTTPDSLSPFDRGGINPYLYCTGDPVNHTDPTGHLSFWAWLGIGLGAAALIATAGTAAWAIAAAGTVTAAISAASATTLTMGTLGVISSSTLIASGALEETSPRASSILGWISIGTALPELVTGLGAIARGAARAAARGGAWSRPALQLAGDAGWDITRVENDLTKTGLSRYEHFDAYAFQATEYDRAGSRVWTSRANVSISDAARTAERAYDSGAQNVDVLYGLHGTNGSDWGPWLTNEEFARETADFWRELPARYHPSTRIVDLRTIRDEKALGELLFQGNTDIIVSFCYSRNNYDVMQFLGLKPVGGWSFDIAETRL